MASNKDIKDLAKELGLHVPDSLSNEEQMKLIADQLGVKNYKPSEKSNLDLHQLLKDKKAHVKIPVKTITVVNGETIETLEPQPQVYETLYDDVPEPKTNYQTLQPQDSTINSSTNNDNVEPPEQDTISKRIENYYENHKNDLKNNENEPLENTNNDNQERNEDATKEQDDGTNANDENESNNTTKPRPDQELYNKKDLDESEESTDSNKKTEQSNEKKDDSKESSENKAESKKENVEKEKNNSESQPGQKDEKSKTKSDSPAEKKGQNSKEKKAPNKADSNNTLNNKSGQKKERKTNPDITKHGRKNMEQAKKAKKATKKATSAPKKELSKKASQAGKKAAKALGEGIKTAVKAVTGFIKSTLIPFIMSNPWILAIFALVLFFALVLIVILMGADPKTGHNTGYQGTQCSYDLTGVVNTGNVTLNDVVVELINCDGRPNDYTVLETVDFEKYALGVALAQMGEDAPDEAIKAQIIVARNFALTRNSTMCADDPENCFYGYNISTGKIRMRACDLDQVYWDYEKSIYTDESSGVKKYSPEATSSTGLLWKTSLTGERKDEVLALAREVKGKVLLDNEDKVLKISSSLAAVNNIFSLAYEGKVYEEILASSYGSGNINTSNCSSVGNIDFGDYNLNSDGDSILHKNLATFLSEQGTSLEEFNNIIAKNVSNSGYGTRAGVVAAAVTLVAELGNTYDVKVPYFWGGGHSGGISEYADATWGSNSCHIYANSQNYNYCGLDCTGFVSWALHNGGYNLNSARGNFYKMDGAKKTSLKDETAVLQAGDLLESKSHVVMVIGVDNDRRQYICVEASGNEDGIWFTRRPFAPTGYWGVLMDDYYNDGSNVRS